jgi:hypothetical protein
LAEAICESSWDGLVLFTTSTLGKRKRSLAELAQPGTTVVDPRKPAALTAAITFES